MPLWARSMRRSAKAFKVDAAVITTRTQQKSARGIVTTSVHCPQSETLQHTGGLHETVGSIPGCASCAFTNRALNARELAVFQKTDYRGSCRFRSVHDVWHPKCRRKRSRHQDAVDARGSRQWWRRARADHAGPEPGRCRDAERK